MSDYPIDVTLGMRAGQYNAALDDLIRRSVSLAQHVEDAGRKADTSFREGFTAAGKSVGSFVQNANSGLNLFRTTVATVAASTVVHVGHEMVQAFSEAEAAHLRFATSFGESARVASSGLSLLQVATGRQMDNLEGMAAGFNTLLSQMGVTGDSAAQLSAELTKLAMATSIQSGQSPDAAVRLLEGAIAGQTRGLRELGLVVPKTAIDQERLALGFDRGAAAATAEQEAVARLSAILKAGAPALERMGDFSESTSERMQRAASMWGEIKESAASLFVGAMDSLGELVSPGYTEDLERGRKAAIELMRSEQELKKQRDAIALAAVAAAAAEEAANLRRLQSGKDASERAVASFNMELEAKKAALAKFETEYKAHVAKLAELDQGRSKARDGFEEQSFRLAYSSMQNDEQRAAALASRIQQLYQQARMLEGAGNPDAAREKLQQAAGGITELYSVRGNNPAELAQFQQALAQVAQWTDTLYQDEQRAEERAAAAALSHVKSLRTEVQTLASDAADAVAAVKALEEEIAKAKGSGGSGVQAAASSTPEVAGAAAGGAASALGRAQDPRDTIPALLREGETVLTPEQSSRLAPALAAAGVPGYADGGLATYQNLLSGTRTASRLRTEAGLADVANQNSLSTADWLFWVSKLGVEGAQQYFARRGAAQGDPFGGGASPAERNFQPLAPTFGFADGGRAGTMRSAKVDVNIERLEISSSGSTQEDARSTARELRRAIARGLVKLED